MYIIVLSRQVPVNTTYSVENIQVSSYNQVRKVKFDPQGFKG